MTIHRNQLKSYAPQARKGFIEAVAARAAKFGITEDSIAPMEEQGDVVIIVGQPFSRAIAKQRRVLEARVSAHGYVQAMEEIAYTWFNRFMAIRFMELNGYLDHGFRVLSHPDGQEAPEILQHAEHVDLTGLDRSKVVDLRLDGTKDDELYRMLLVAQCNALHGAMPFLFERIDDETELLLPDHLLRSDSLIRDLVNDVDEENWNEIEVIGWLYQFYISEKKDQVMGKVVKSEDIPAATQLFTPNWIVKYMVQNSLGYHWLVTYPESSLKDRLEYYIEPAEQTEEVKVQLKEITPTELNPEKLTLLDPAAGSGHILVEAYDLFKEIYLERGYRLREVPRLILEKNLYGLDIDERAAQMAGFALLMKARGDDRRIIDPENPVNLNVLAIQSSEGLDAARLAFVLQMDGTEIREGTLNTLINVFEDAKTFGSLISIPENLKQVLPALKRLIEQPSEGDMVQVQLRNDAIASIEPLVKQAETLGRFYDAVVANPPYMGNKHFSGLLKQFAKNNYNSGKADLYGCFIERGFSLLKDGAIQAQINIPNWMFLSGFEGLRYQILDKGYFKDFVHNGRGVFGSDFGSCAFTIRKVPQRDYKGIFKRLFDRNSQVSNNHEISKRFHTVVNHLASGTDFESLPGAPLAYWVTNAVRKIFAEEETIEKIADARQGLATANNDLFLRLWHEVSISSICFGAPSNLDAEGSMKRWFPHNKGGNFRRWYGNIDYVVDWENSGKRIYNFKDDKGKRLSAPRNVEKYFSTSVSWSDVTISDSAFRFYPKGFIFDGSAHSSFYKNKYEQLSALAYLNTKFVNEMVKILNPSVHFHVGYFKKLPFPQKYLGSKIFGIAEIAVKLSEFDWNLYETSWDFTQFPLLSGDLKQPSIKTSYQAWEIQCNSNVQNLKELEEENNRLFIEAYGLQDELDPEVLEDQITLARADQEQDIKRLISYSLGCMMGRYSLIKEGLVYANAGNEGFDPSLYGNFPADDDGIVPISENDGLAFDDDAAIRFKEFLKEAWSEETFSENQQFIGESIGAKKTETPMEAIRRYLSKDFFKDHLKTYKKRPIYWLFSSGKLKAFECLVYLHRYNEGTLARMRMEYVTPLQSRMANRIETLSDDIKTASSAEAKRKQKEKDKLGKQLEELRKFDEELRHLADQRITIDLDDGVKVNYEKFGNLLAETKAITGKK